MKSKKNAIKLTLGILWWCVLGLLAAVLVNVIGAKLSGRVPSAFGYSVVNIVSGSMEDEIPKDSYILLKRALAEEVERGDVICFYSSDPTIYGMPNTHRVVEEPIITENGIEFVTRGDANPENDKTTAKGENLIGIYVGRLDGLTSFSNLLSGNALVFIIIGVQICIVTLVIYNYVASKHAKSEDKEQNSEQEKKQD